MPTKTAPAGDSRITPASPSNWFNEVCEEVKSSVNYSDMSLYDEYVRKPLRLIEALPMDAQAKALTMLLDAVGSAFNALDCDELPLDDWCEQLDEGGRPLVGSLDCAAIETMASGVLEEDDLLSLA